MGDSTQQMFPFLDYTVEGLRCFREPAAFREARHVNVVSGQNNSGKSTILLPLRRLTTVHHPLPQVYDGHSYFGGDLIGDLRFLPEDISHGADRCKITFHRALPSDATLEVRRQAAARTRGGITASFEYGPILLPDGTGYRKDLNQPREHFCKDLGEYGRNIVYIPAKRRVGQALHEDDLPRSAESVFDGSTVLPLLLRSANPAKEHHDEFLERKAWLDSVERQFGFLMGSDVRLRPLPAERDVEVIVSGKATALTRLGAGIEQLLILAVALVQHEDCLLLIEEPENFLHPTLQRRVLEQLLERKAPAVVTTHSNHLLDIRDERLAYYRTFFKSPASASVERMDTDRKYSILWDLGVRPSSLFESNASLWVEGPSDAIYLRAWLSMLPEAEGVVEGIHYTFAFHGGALLDKFFIDADGDQARDSRRIVDFCALHPNFFIVADRDADGGEPGHEYLRRIADDPCSHGKLWISEGKEVENYLPKWLFARYLSSRASPRREVRYELSIDQCRTLPFWRILNEMAGEKVRSDYPNKVIFAEWAAAELASPGKDDNPLDVLDLRDRLLELVGFITAKSHVFPAPNSDHPLPSLQGAGPSSV